MFKPLKFCACSIVLLCLLAMPAKAEWRNEIGIFRIGIVAEGENASFFIKLDPFRLALIEALQIEVEFYAAPNATSIIDALRSERIEYGIVPSTAFALAWNICECVEPVVVPKAADSTDGFYSVLIARPNGPNSLQGFAKGSIGVLSKGSITNHTLPVTLLEKEGLTFSEDATQLKFFDTPSETLQAFINEEIDGVIGWSSLTGEPSNGFTRGTLSRLASQLEVDVSDYKIIWQSPQFPHRPHIVRKKLNAEVKRILRDTLIDLYDQNPIAYDAVEPVLGGGFTSTRKDRFNDLIEYVDTLYQKPKTPVLPSVEKAPEAEASDNKDEISND